MIVRHVNMFYSITDAGNEIGNLVTQGLGPITNEMSIVEILLDISIQLCATILLFVIVRFFLWKPITNILEQRRAAIDKNLLDAEEAKNNAIEIEANLNKELLDAKAQVKEMLDRAEKEANLKREAIINSAKEDARHRLENLEIELDQEKKSMEKEIRKEIVNVAFAAAEKIVKKEINQDKYLDVVNDILKGANE